MDALPQELIDRITNFLPPNDLRNSLVLSRKFQYAAERTSGAFSCAKLTSEKSTIQNFLSTYNSHRFLYLRDVIFHTSIPMIEVVEDPDYCPEQICRETEEDLQLINEEFSKQVRTLFQTLQTLENCVLGQYGPGNIHLEISTPLRHLGDHACYHRQFSSWRVRLLSASSDLPKVSSVRGLTLKAPKEGHGTFSGHTEYRVLIDIARGCPNLNTLKCRLAGCEWIGSFQLAVLNASCGDWAGPRRDSRHSFSKAMQDLGPALQFLRHADLNFLYPLAWAEDFDHHIPLPDLVKPELYDTFSSGLRILSYSLRTMTLRVIADETLFWPTDSSEVPAWPNMQSMNIMFNNSHPDGSWYFSSTPSPAAGYEVTSAHYPPFEPTEQDEADDDDDDAVYAQWNVGETFQTSHTRVFPQEPKISRFLAAFAKAATHMPKLKKFLLWTPILFKSDAFEEEFPLIDPKTITKYARPESSPNELAWGIAYTAPGVEIAADWSTQHDTSVRNLWWKVGQWRPGAELLSLLEAVGGKEYGGKISQHWNDGKDGKDGGLDGLRHLFTYWKHEG